MSERRKELERIEQERLAKEAPTETEEQAQLKELLKQQEQGQDAGAPAP